VYHSSTSPRRAALSGRGLAPSYLDSVSQRFEIDMSAVPEHPILTDLIDALLES
jgi:hypothetical protein